MFTNNLKHYIERFWEMILKFQIHYSIYLDEYYVLLNKIFLPHQYNILSMWMEFYFLCGKYLVYVARIFFKDFVLLTKVLLTCSPLTLKESHGSYVVVSPFMNRMNFPCAL